MAIRKRVASMTAGVGGNAVDSDVLISTTGGSAGRWAGLYAVEWTTEDNTDADCPLRLGHLSVWESTPDASDPTDRTDDTQGDLLFHVADMRPDRMYYPRRESDTTSVDHGSTYPASADSSGEENALPRIRTNRLQVEADGVYPRSTSVITVNVYVESAGDQRF